jgi:hypothetical protein
LLHQPDGEIGVLYFGCQAVDVGLPDGILFDDVLMLACSGYFEDGGQAVGIHGLMEGGVGEPQGFSVGNGGQVESGGAVGVGVGGLDVVIAISLPEIGMAASQALQVAMGWGVGAGILDLQRCYEVFGHVELLLAGHCKRAHVAGSRKVDGVLAQAVNEPLLYGKMVPDGGPGIVQQDLDAIGKFVYGGHGIPLCVESVTGREPENFRLPPRGHGLRVGSQGELDPFGVSAGEQDKVILSQGER